MHVDGNVRNYISRIASAKEQITICSGDKMVILLKILDDYTRADTKPAEHKTIKKRIKYKNDSRSA